MIKILMVGASPCSQMLASLLPERIVDHIDDNQSLWGNKTVNGKVLSIETKDILKVINKYDGAFIGVGVHKLMAFRKKMYKTLSDKIFLINIFHPSAVISSSAAIGHGNYCGALSYIAPYTKIGDCNFFSANTIIEHHCEVGDLNSWGPSVSLSGSCKVGDEVCIGTNVGVIWDIKIGSRSRIASGVCLHTSIGKDCIVRKKNFPDVEAYDFIDGEKNKVI